jgi:hypothetical protein
MEDNVAFRADCLSRDQAQLQSQGQQQRVALPGRTQGRESNRPFRKYDLEVRS